MGLRVADFFCGAGGFSEGFRQMGFDIIYGMDIWPPAVKTFQKNFPKAEVPDPMDILDIKIGDLPDVDVVIGGPPCTFFSSSNRGGNGDVSSGMRFIRRFLKIVEELGPKWWVMENVPRLGKTLPNKVSYWRLGIREKGKYIEIPQIEPLNAADYGVPQARTRLFSGNYPIPTRTHSGNGEKSMERWRWMKDIVGGLPYPLRKKNNTEVKDPLYSHITLDSNILFDHRYDTFLTNMEIEDVKRMKTRHRYYGKMSFPDNLNRPARTVMASMIRTSRETMVIEEKRGKKKGYRIPTVRECASLQSFPINYHFWAPTVSYRYKLIGNAVPPILARSIAKEILIAEGKSYPKYPIIQTEVNEIPEPLSTESTSRKGRGSRYPLYRYYCDFIGHRANHSGTGCRIDIDNKGDDPYRHPIYGKKGIRHIVEWRCVLYTGYAKNVKDKVITLNDAISLINENNTILFNNKIKRIINDLLNKKIQEIPDATTSQGIWSGRVRKRNKGPFWIRRTLSSMVDKAFPKGRKTEEKMDDFGEISIRKKIKFTQRDAAKVILTTITATIMNESAIWLLENWDNHFRLDDWPIVGKKRSPPKPRSIRKLINVSESLRRSD